MEQVRKAYRVEYISRLGDTVVVEVIATTVDGAIKKAVEKSPGATATKVELMCVVTDRSRYLIGEPTDLCGG